MKALIYHGKNEIHLEEIETPRPEDGQALLKVKAAAICGTDLRVNKSGHRDIPFGTKRILGHELAGEIAKVGDKVKDLKPGMRVAIAPVIGCGKCKVCLSGDANMCEKCRILGLGIDGAFAEYMIIPSEHIDNGNVMVIPTSISFETAALLEPLATVFTGAEACNIKPSNIVMVVGAGPIGTMHVMMANIFGASKVIVSEIAKERAKQALHNGADIVLNPAESDFKEKLLEITGGRGPDNIIIAAPSPQAQIDSLELISVNGHINFFGTIPSDKQPVSLNTNLIHYKRINLVGNTGTSVKNYFSTAELLKSGKLDISGLISKTFPLEKAEEAFDLAESKEVLKVLFTF
ncbi:alcohol dehydrogenase catalytic domain-containing protein [Actinomycetota bacterium]